MFPLFDEGSIPPPPSLVPTYDPVMERCARESRSIAKARAFRRARSLATACNRTSRRSDTRLDSGGSACPRLSASGQQPAKPTPRASSEQIGDASGPTEKLTPFTSAPRPEMAPTLARANDPSSHTSAFACNSSMKGESHDERQRSTQAEDGQWTGANE
jgi:hypothetical protein